MEDADSKRSGGGVDGTGGVDLVEARRRSGMASRRRSGEVDLLLESGFAWGLMIGDEEDDD